MRDTSVFAFFMLNALFVLVVFLLQLNKDKIYIVWFWGVKTFISFDEDNQEVKELELATGCVGRRGRMALGLKDGATLLPLLPNVNCGICLMNAFCFPNEEF